MVRSRYVITGLLLLSLILLTSCPNNSNYTVGVGNVDETTPQKKAMIRLSPPQVFSREALINDRLREYEFIGSQIEDSPNKEFLPQLNRDIATISTMSAQLGLSVDPSIGLKFKEQKQQSEISSITNEIEIFKIRNQLNQLKAQIKTVEKVSQEEPAAPENTEEQTAEEQTAEEEADTSTQTAADVESIKKSLNDLTTLVANLPDKLTARARGSSIQASPEDRYADLQAYRAQLRADQAAVNLDDVFDKDGNALYRMQFRAHLFPGQEKNKWGVVRINAEAPKLKESDVRFLYFSWLAHCTYRLNSLGNSNTSSEMIYKRLGVATQLFHVARLDIDKSALKTGDKDAAGQASHPPRPTIYLAVMPGHKEKIEEYYSLYCKDNKNGNNNDNVTNIYETIRHNDLEIEKYALSGLKDKIILRAITEKLYLPATKIGSTPEGELIFISHYIGALIRYKIMQKEHIKEIIRGKKSDEFFSGTKIKGKSLYDYTQQALVTAKEVLRIIPSAEASISGLLDSGLLDEELEATKQLQHALEAFDQIASAAALYVDFMQGASNKVGEIIKSQAQEIPPIFCKVLFNDISGADVLPCGLCSKQSKTAKGSTYAYTAMPFEKAQRLSTVASAANSMGLAFALAAAVPSSGMKGAAGFGHLKSAMGKVDALERAPVVVGFADGADRKSGSSTDNPRLDGQAHFGWIFGPRIHIDPEGNKLEFKQNVATYRIFADLSIPAWWPRIKLKVESAWIKNWYDPNPLDYIDTKVKEGQSYGSEPPETSSIEVALPLSRADLDALTDRLRRNIFKHGLRRTQIDYVEPSSVATGDGEITFLVYGANLWRDPQAYIRGIKSPRNPRMLPDMTGIEVVFNMNKLPRRSGEEDKIRIVTRNGSASYKLHIKETRGGAASGVAITEVKLLKGNYILTEKLTLTIDPDKLPAGFFKLTVGLRPSNAPSAIPWTTGPAELNRTLKQVGGAINITGSTLSEYDSGALLDAALLIQFRDHETPVAFKARQNLVLYKTADDAKVKVVGEPNIDELPKDVSLKLPLQFTTAYPELATREQRMKSLKAKIAKTNIILPVSELPYEGGSEYKISIEPPGKPDEQYKKAREKDVELSLVFKNVTNAPEIKGTIKLQKQQQ